MIAFDVTWVRARVRSRRIVSRSALAVMVSLVVASAMLVGWATPVASQTPVVEDGYDLWLRYRPLPAGARLEEYRAALREVAIDTTTPTRAIAADELRRALRGLLGREPNIVGVGEERRASLVIGTPASSPFIAAMGKGANLAGAGREGFVLGRTIPVGRRTRSDAPSGGRRLHLAANTDIGLLYGTFALIRQLQIGRPLVGPGEVQAPRISRRILNHWDNLDRTVERGYAGKSIWDWNALPDTVALRIIDYARANASIGINGTVLTNVNANATVLTAPYIAKPNEPRGDIFLPTIGHMLAFIYTLDHPEMVGLNPEVAHDQMAGLDFSHGVAQAMEAGKLFHIDLNGQKPGRFDQDLRFGSEDVKGAFFLVKLLEESGWPGMRHFDSHAYRTEDEAGVWEFAKGSMRTYLILKEKVARYNADPEISALRASLAERGGAAGLRVTFSEEGARELQSRTFDLDGMRAQGYDYERLDQLTMEVLLGVR